MPSRWHHVSHCALFASLALLPAAASAQVMIIGDSPRAVSVGASLASVDGKGRAPGVSVAGERVLGTDGLGRSIALRVRGGSERVWLGGDETGGSYVRRRQIGIGLTRYIVPGPRGGVDPYLFLQANRQWVHEREGMARTDGLGFGAGLDIAPSGSPRSFVLELELGVGEPARLPSGRYLEGVGLSRLHVGYKRRF
ncbi:MAG TPA: hypothetical protein VMF13_09095 [Luteitalea sp.]|nr:hypothetical protein [Luteitalea sp.]